MTYLIHNPAVPIRKLDTLTGTEDAEIGALAITPEGDRHTLTSAGWIKVWDHETGAVPPDVPLPEDQAIVTDGEELAVTGGTVTLSVADNVVTAEYTPD